MDAAVKLLPEPSPRHPTMLCYEPANMQLSFYLSLQDAAVHALTESRLAS